MKEAKNIKDLISKFFLDSMIVAFLSVGFLVFLYRQGVLKKFEVFFEEKIDLKQSFDDFKKSFEPREFSKKPEETSLESFDYSRSISILNFYNKVRSLLETGEESDLQNIFWLQEQLLNEKKVLFEHIESFRKFSYDQSVTKTKKAEIYHLRVIKKTLENLNEIVIRIKSEI